MEAQYIEELNRLLMIPNSLNEPFCSITFLIEPLTFKNLKYKWKSSRLKNPNLAQTPSQEERQ